MKSWSPGRELSQRLLDAAQASLFDSPIMKSSKEKRQRGIRVLTTAEDIMGRPMLACTGRATADLGLSTLTAGLSTDFLTPNLHLGAGAENLLASFFDVVHETVPNPGCHKVVRSIQFDCIAADFRLQGLDPYFVQTGGSVPSQEILEFYSSCLSS